MKNKERIQKSFLALVSAGLWEKEVSLSVLGDIDLKNILRLAQEQSVVGLIAAGIEQVKDVQFPKEDVLSIVGESLQLERRNLAMNSFVEDLIVKLKETNILALIVKGQGIAQCYERPLWRASGDVDILLSEGDYKKTATFLSPLASSVEEDVSSKKHTAMNIGPWIVELHGTLRSGLWKSIDRTIDETQNDVFSVSAVRLWMNGNTQVLLPRADEDVVFVFSHILQHFFSEGIGLRQVCDWCRLLWTFRDAIDVKLLESRIQSMGVMTEWKTFAALAVDYLGMTKETIPFYSPSNRWKRKAERVMAFILKVGNFGNNRDRSYVTKSSYASRKIISLWRHTCDTVRYFFIFPFDSIKVWFSMLSTGVVFMAKGK